MSKGNRLRTAKKNKMIFDHMRLMEKREAIRRTFAMTPIAIAVKQTLQNWGK